MAYLLLIFFSILCFAIVGFVGRFYKSCRHYPPGPMPLPIIGNLHQVGVVNTHKYLEKLSHKYGAVFTVFLPKPTVVITGLTEMQEALVRKGDIFAGRAPRALGVILQSVENGGLFSSENETWRDQRRFAISTLCALGMGRKLMEEKILTSVTRMMMQVDELAMQTTADLKWPLQLCIGNVISDLLFGLQFTENNCSQLAMLKAVLERVLQRVRTRKSLLYILAYPWLKHVPFLGYYGYWELRKEAMPFLNFIYAEIEKIAARSLYDDGEEEPTNFVSAYLREINRRRQIGDQQSSFSLKQLANVATDLWLGSMETTTVTLRWAVLLLVAHPEVQAKLQAEIDAVIGRDRCPNMGDKTSMPYMSAVLMEVQRKANVISFNSPHRTLKDTTIGGLFIPVDTAVLPQLTTVLDNPTVFDDPSRFNPDRFLEEDGKTFRKVPVESLVPFGMGKRQCAGESIARMSLFLVITTLMQHYSLLVPEDGKPPDLTPTYGVTLLPQQYECKIVRR